MSSPAGVKLPEEEFSKIIDTLIDDYKIKNMVTRALTSSIDQATHYVKQKEEEITRSQKPG